MKSVKNEQTFEAAMLRLEEIVKLLENGGAPLDETMNLYAEGSKLAVLCSTKLEKAKQTVTQINDAKNKKADESENA